MSVKIWDTPAQLEMSPPRVMDPEPAGILVEEVLLGQLPTHVDPKKVEYRLRLSMHQRLIL